MTCRRRRGFEGGPEGADGPFRVRKQWLGDEGVQSAEPLRSYTPRTLEHIVGIVRVAVDEGVGVKAIGAGNSYSNVRLARDFQVDCAAIDFVRPYSDRLVSPSDAFFEVGAGVRMKALNDALWERGRALLTMGSFDGITLVGSSQTATHGSGPRLGEVSSQIVSICIVVGDGRALRIEPTDGISSAAEEGVTLVQDDRTFYAVVVAMGCMGVIHSVVVRTVPKYRLREVRTLHPWSEVRAMLGGSLLADNHWVEIWLSPHEKDGDRQALLTVRNPFDGPAEGKARRRPWLSELLAGLPVVSELGLTYMDHFPEKSLGIIDQAMTALDDDAFVGPPGDVLIDILAPHGYANELFFPMRDGRYLDAIDAYFDLAERHVRLGRRYMNLLAVRFVAASKAYMAMNHGEDVCAIELPTLAGWTGARDGFDTVERRMIELGGRPHWALQFDTLTNSRGLIDQMYPQYATFRQVYQELDPDGRFANAFTDRIGLTSPTFNR